LESLSAGDVVSVWFEDEGEWSTGTVVGIAPDYKDPFGVDFPGSDVTCWISLDEGVKLLDESGFVVAATPDVVNTNNAPDEPLTLACELEEELYLTMPAEKLQPVLQCKSGAQLHQLLMEIHCPPKASWKKDDMIKAFIAHRGDDMKKKLSPSNELAEFFAPAAREGECLVSSDYRRWMSAIDKSDQAHAAAFPGCKIVGGHERAFVFHLLTVLFVNARAAHLDLVGSASAPRPTSVKDYIREFVRSRLARKEKK
jgi:hypothetical protein